MIPAVIATVAVPPFARWPLPLLGVPLALQPAAIKELTATAASYAFADRRQR